MSENLKLNDGNLEDLLSVAIKAAKAAQVVIKKYYKKAPETEIKQDQTPVTIADKKCEMEIRSVISEAYPDHGFYGEEFGKSDSDSDFVWLIDPIDGTKSFVREYPFFSTQIALMYKSELIIGVSNAPEFSEMAWACKGGGAFLNGEKILVNQDFEWNSSCISTGNVKTLLEKSCQTYSQLLLKFSKIRGYGDFYHYHLLASGKLDLVLESDVNILDIAALSLIVREAGGIMTEMNGNQLNLLSTTVLAGNKKTYELGLKILNE